MSNFTKLFIGLLLLVALLGFVLPFLVSAKSTELVSGGMLMVITVLYVVGKKLFKE